MTDDLLTMPAGPALRRAIAEKLGYSVRRGRGQWWIVGGQFKDGMYLCLAHPSQDTEEYAWSRVFPDEHDCELDGPLADWTTSTDAALTLFAGQDIDWSLRYSRGVYHFVVMDQLTEAFIATGEADTPALAICRAWLKMAQE